MQNIFSYPLIVADISQEEKKYDFKVGSKQLDLVRDILNIPAVKELKATLFTNHSHKEHLLKVYGNIKVLVELESVISLKLFDKSYDISFEQVYDTKMTRAEQKELEEIQSDVPDIILGEKIDLCEIIIEQIALNLDCYPRKDGEVFEFKPDFDLSAPTCENPFEILAKFKK